MTKEELAAILNGREYRSEMTLQEERDARINKLLVAFGASDDLLEIRGTTEVEFGAYNGGIFVLTKNLTVIEPHDDHDELVEAGWTPPVPFLTIKAEWCPPRFAGSWRISSDVPFSKFNIMDGGDLFCEGIVIDLREIAGKP